MHQYHVRVILLHKKTKTTVLETKPAYWLSENTEIPSSVLMVEDQLSLDNFKKCRRENFIIHQEVLSSVQGSRPTLVRQFQSSEEKMNVVIHQEVLISVLMVEDRISLLDSFRKWRREDVIIYQ